MPHFSRIWSIPGPLDPTPSRPSPPRHSSVSPPPLLAQSITVISRSLLSHQLPSPFLCLVIPFFYRVALAKGLLSSLMLLQGFGQALSVINAGTIYHLPASRSGCYWNGALSRLYSPHLAADLSPGWVGGEFVESWALRARWLRPATSCLAWWQSFHLRVKMYSMQTELQDFRK